MNSITINDVNLSSTFTLTTEAKLAMTYIAAHLTAISTIGTFYLLGLFNVGFLSQESLAVKYVNYLISTIS